MKRIILYFIASIAMLAFFSNCNDDNNPQDFSMYPSGLVIGADGGADFIEIKSSQPCWIKSAFITDFKDTTIYPQGKYMVIKKDWYYCDIQRGNLVIHLDTNKSTRTRVVDLYITAGGESQLVGIVQNPQDRK